MTSSRLAVVQRHLEGSGNVALDQTATPSFIYTVDNPRLSWEQRKFYEDNGFLVIPRLVGDALLDECSRRFKDVCEGRIPVGTMRLVKDVSLAKAGAKGEYLYNKAFQLLWDEVFTKYNFADEVLDYVECFTGPDVKVLNSALINKPPDSGKMTSRHPLHQDHHYFAYEPVNRIVASWTAMEKVTVDNGCLVVIPGSHKSQLLPHEYPPWENGVNKMYLGVQGYDDHPLHNLEMEKGDTAFFHPLLIHGSGANITKGFRKALSSHFSATDCVFVDVEGTSRENVTREANEYFKKKGLNLDFKKFMRFNSRVVRGKGLKA